MVEGPMFRKIFTHLAPDFEIPDQPGIAALIENQCPKAQAKVVRELADAGDCLVSLSVHSWTSHVGDAFLGVMCHWVNARFERRRMPLEFFKFEHCGRDDMLAMALVGLCDQYGISKRVHTVTSDGAMCNAGAMQILERELAARGGVLTAEHGYIQSLGTVLDAAAQHIMFKLQRQADMGHRSPATTRDMLGPTFGAAIDLLSAVPRAMPANPDLRFLLHDKCYDAGDKYVAPPPGCLGDWHVVFELANWGLKMQPHIDAVIAMGGSSLRPLDDSHWMHLARFAKDMRHFVEALQKASDKKYTSISVAIPLFSAVVHMLRTRADAARKDAANPALGSPAAAAAAAIRDYAAALDGALEELRVYDPSHKPTCVYVVGMVLDPRHILTHYDAALKAAKRRKNSDDAVRQLSDARLQAVAAMRRVYEQYKQRLGAATANPGAPQAASAVRRVYEQCRQLFGARTASPGAPQAAAAHAPGQQNLDTPLNAPPPAAPDELDRYLARSVIDGRNDAVQWWRKNQSRYPVLSRVARDYQCIPPTLASLERLFSRAEAIDGEEHDLLPPEAIRAQTLLGAWVTGEYPEDNSDSGFE